mgnify:CR=1 FL=1
MIVILFQVTIIYVEPKSSKFFVFVQCFDMRHDTCIVVDSEGEVDEEGNVLQNINSGPP